jgi:hypothetical protein
MRVRRLEPRAGTIDGTGKEFTMSAIAHVPSKAILPAIGHNGARRQQAAGLAVRLSRLAASAAGLLPVLVPPLLGYALIIGISPG